MEIIIGKTAGFCYGVKRAVEGCINEIENAVNDIDYLKEYKGLVLFDDKLPIPPGSDINYNYDFSRPTAHIYSHK